MTRANVPERVAWAVSMMNIRPTDHILEIGCGRGEAVALISGMLDGGTITAIDRSGKMIAIASERNASGVATGVVTFQAASVAEADFGDRLFDLIFAINVGSLWRQHPPHDLARLRDVLAPEGRLYLFHETPPGSAESPVAAPIVGLAAVDGLTVADSRVKDFGRTRCGCDIAARSTVS